MRPSLILITVLVGLEAYKMKQRVITGACIAVVMVAILGFSHVPYVMPVFVSILSMVAVYELYHVGGMLGKTLPFLLSLLWAGFFSFVPISFYVPLLATVLGCSMLLSGWNMKYFGKIQLKKAWIVFLISLVFPILYNSIAYLRLQEHGLWYVILVIISCFGTDTGAYFIGRAFGTHKLAPIISPKKTIEGFIGGIAINVVAYLIVGFILRFAVDIPIRLPLLAGLGVVCGALDQFGDLSMSAIKRNFGVKDFGNLMPGHGGVLDRFDSLLFVGSFVCVFITWIPILYI